MELPVSNRSLAIRRILAINFLLVSLLILILFQRQNLDIINYLIIIFSLSSIASFTHFKKQNIQKAFFDNRMVKLEYNKNAIEFPISQIISISESLNDFITLKGKMSYTYIIKLNYKYQFGNKLYLNFEKTDNVGIEPKEIIKLREKIKNGC